MKKILIIEDDWNFQALLSVFLCENGFEVESADGGKAGLDLINAKLPDAILLDLFMPDLDGFAVLEQLRTSAEWSRIPVLILTGADLTAEQHKQLNEFGNTMLSKSQLRENDLLTLLEEALRKLRLPK